MMRARDTETPPRGLIRACVPADRADMLGIVNAAAEAYRATIPADCWHEPYMTERELAEELAAGVVFSGYGTPQGLVGIMGRQPMRNVDLIRHAYVLPGFQGQGIASALIARIRPTPSRPVLVGTWRAAEWAIRFYGRHGFMRVPEADATALLRAYWTVSDRQIAASVVLSAPALEAGHAAALVAGARDDA